MCSAWERDSAVQNLDHTDLIITAGGDGTILRAAQVALHDQIPITGVNMGKLGFLTELKANEAISLLPELLAGHGWMDERVMLETTILSSELSLAENTFHALNDVVLARDEVAKLIQIDASIDDKPLTTYRADGLILSTATGSTGYSLAAGGPVLYPESTDFVMVPIVPHLSLGYSLVLPSSSVVRLQPVTTTRATMSIDGHINITLPSGALVSIKKSSRKTRFLRLNPQNTFFNVLEEKLRGINR